MSNTAFGDDTEKISEDLMKLVIQFTSNMNSVIEYAEYLQPITDEKDTATFIKSSKSSAAIVGFKEGEQLMQFVEAALNPDNEGKKISDLINFDLKKLMEKFKGIDEALNQFENMDRSKLDLSQIDYGIKGVNSNGESFPEMLKKAGLEFDKADTSKLTMADFTSAANRPNKTKLLFQTSLITLISMYESMISDLLRIYYNANNLALPKEKKQLSLSDLKSFGSIENAIDNLIDLEINSFLYKSIDDWQEFFKENIDLDLKSVSVKWHDVVEVYQRRHIFVHNNGKVNRQYLAKVDVGHKKDLSTGDKLTIDIEYLKHASDLLQSQGFLIINALWAKLLKKDVYKRFVGATYVTTQAMENRRWEITRSCLTEFLKDKRVNGAERMLSQINLWLSIKRIEGLQSIKSELDKFDHSTTKSKYSAVVYALQDDIESFVSIYRETDITKHDLSTWPVFEEFRSLPEFQVLLN